ncbi:MAG: PIN domain-containing protein [Thermoplasmatota archaeon]
MPAIDADALVALHTSTHPHHAKARRLFEQATQIYLHPSVATEFTTVLRRQANKANLDGNQVAREALRSLLAQPRVQMSVEVRHHDAVERYLSHPVLSFTDAIVAGFRWSADKQDPITFDKVLLKAASSKPV